MITAAQLHKWFTAADSSGVATVSELALLLDVDEGFARRWARTHELRRVGATFIFTERTALQLMNNVINEPAVDALQSEPPSLPASTTIAEASVMCNVPRRTIYGWIERGTLNSAVRVDGTYTVNPAEIRTMADTAKLKPEPEPSNLPVIPPNVLVGISPESRAILLDTAHMELEKVLSHPEGFTRHRLISVCALAHHFLKLVGTDQ